MSAASGLRLTAAVVVVMSASAWSQPASVQTPAAGSGSPTFARDVAPIFQERCEVCHRPGNIGPMSLVTYEEVRPWVRSIRARVASRRAVAEVRVGEADAASMTPAAASSP